jgi:hypothetical protein
MKRQKRQVKTQNAKVKNMNKKDWERGRLACLRKD